MRQLIGAFDTFAIRTCSSVGSCALRIGVGIVYVWFGVLKYFPHASPAEDLVGRTVSWAVNPEWFIPLLATWEVAIGLGFLTGRFPRLTLALFFLHMPGTFMPLFVCPELVWTEFPHSWTLEGQYIIKNLVLIGAGLTIAGRLSPRTQPSLTSAEPGVSA